LGQFADGLDDQDALSYLFFVIATILSMLILANMLIEIVGQTFGEVSEKKYLYVFRERVDLIADFQTSKVIYRFTHKLVKRVTIDPVAVCLLKCIPKNNHCT